MLLGYPARGTKKSRVSLFVRKRPGKVLLLAEYSVNRNTSSAPTTTNQKPKIPAFDERMDSFSWSDSIRATLGSCIPCLKTDADSDDEGQQGQGRGQRRVGATSLRTSGANAREELERLLDEPITDAEDAETMSLHSNVGNRKKKRKTQRGQKGVKSVRVFGIDLFGRRSIRLPDDDAVENEGNEESFLARDNPRRIRTISTSTLDSDAAPLADDAIIDFTARAQQRWAPSRNDEELAVEERIERERIEREQRKESRRERKEMKRLAEMGAFSSPMDGEEFEGFPGSGQLSHPGALGQESSSADEFGPFVTVSGDQMPAQEDKEVEDDADFDAAAYTKKRRTGGGEDSGSGSHSRSRSRTSASLSADGSAPAKRPSKGPSTEKRAIGRRSPLIDQVSEGSSTPRNQSSARDRKKSKRSKSSHASSSATPSIPSPVSTPFPEVNINSQEFDGVPGGLISARDHLNAFAQSTNLPSPSLSSGFPSTGFSNFKRTTSNGLSSGAGVALARRGDD